MPGYLLGSKVKRQVILISVLLALTVTVNAGFAFEDKQGTTAKKGDQLQKSVDHIYSAVEIALDKTGKALEKAGNKTSRVFGIAAGKTRQALGRAGKKIQGWFDDKPNASK